MTGGPWGAPEGPDGLARRLDELTSVLQRGDRLVVSELSRLGRSLGQIVTILDTPRQLRLHHHDGVTPPQPSERGSRGGGAR